ncbi:YeeE/YedE family protein [Pelomonas sp. CA6]|uniref:YeeE/YedE family protein n=1 Tax=Pelomonas sp. CA6 TaxID=2907999 RepID=UPI001F4AA44A|nr:YeeE/YedE family protein [Pelomonas sp. CA6]MCH7342285.1 YeeE/YedE family protein [Pelomonas sp. CA6]
MDAWLERLGQAQSLGWGGLLIGLVFGFFAQRSRFCLRSATIEFSRGLPGGKLTVWLFAFSFALLVTQGLIALGWMDVGAARQLATRGSLSGALVGGAMFGCGMILARGCSSRLLVLAAQGNLRSVLSGLVFAVTAQAAWSGALAPLREHIAGWWTVEGGPARDLLAISGLGRPAALLMGALWLLAAIRWARHQRVGAWGWGGASMVGLSVAGAWWFTAWVASSAFDAQPAPVQSLSFTGPSAEVLVRVLFAPEREPSFDFGLVPGVFLGSFLAAALFRELKLEGFNGGPAMRRYLVGAMLMGFGGMLAGGCAVGAGLSGAAVFNLTAWITLCAMWAAAALTDRLLDQREAPVAATAAQPLDEALPQTTTKG